MSRQLFKPAMAMAVSLFFVLAVTITAQAEIAKSGTVSFVAGFHSAGNILQFSDNHLFWAGSFKGAGHCCPVD